MREIKVKNVVFGIQFEESANYKELIDISKEKNIKIHIVEAGKRIHIDKNLYLDILWPNSKTVIKENILNNNSLVCKMYYKNFSILFTGDIEELAESEILKKYIGNNILKSTILKVAHHGSKTSSTEEFLNLVRPNIAIIGVGEKNTFGHPNDEVLRRIERLWK